MGDAADDLIDGSACAWCSVYFKKPHGYPVICRGCAGSMSKKALEKQGIQVATEEEIS